MSERSRYRAKIEKIRDRTSLRDLVGHAELLKFVNGKVVVEDRLPAPIDEHGIPRVDIMLNRLFGQMATRAYVWTGKFDLHHMATPKADYSVVAGDLGKKFRGLSALKVELPRQMHNLAHEIFEVTRPTGAAEMNQAILEVEQIKTIYSVAKDKDIEPGLAMSRIHGLLEGMSEPRVGMMPELDALADMELDDLRQTAASLVSVRKYRSRQLVHPALRPKSALRQRAA